MVPLWALTAAATASAPPPPAPAGSPNVLFIAIDDMRPSIGAMGAPVHTPAMDRLASESLMFDRAFANFPWCNPSRNSLLSGRRPDTNKVWNFNVDLRTTFDPDNRCAPLALSPLPLIFSYKSEKSLHGTATRAGPRAPTPAT